jgi:hypothetical protein
MSGEPPPEVINRSLCHRCVVLSGIPRKQGINPAAGFDKSVFPGDGLSRSPASGLGDNLTHG